MDRVESLERDLTFEAVRIGKADIRSRQHSLSAMLQRMGNLGLKTERCDRVEFLAKFRVILPDRPVKTQFVVGHGGVYPLDHVCLIAVGEYGQPMGEVRRNLDNRVLQG